MCLCASYLRASLTSETKCGEPRLGNKFAKLQICKHNRFVSSENAGVLTLPLLSPLVARQWHLLVSPNCPCKEFFNAESPHVWVVASTMCVVEHNHVVRQH